MRVFSKKVLREFWACLTGRQGKHAETEHPLKTWYSETSKAKWKTPRDIKKEFVKASIVGDNRVVFNICGNKYRLVVKFNYQQGWAFIRFIGTHKEYDKINVETI